MAKFCNECGHAVLPTDSYCPECGNSLNHSHNDHQSESQIQKDAEHYSANGAQKVVGLNKSVVLGFRNYVNFQTRSSRSEFWFFILFQIIVCAVFGLYFIVLASMYSASSYSLQQYEIFAGFGSLLLIIFCIGVALPTLALMTRRLHDSGYSAWYVLLGFIPYLGVLILLIFFLLRSEPSKNKYGVVPNVARK
ncbi:MAG: DUF805 domain-containing protein [Candidatus Saccharimonadales bacterium]